MRNRVVTILLAMVLMAGVTALGCSSKPPEDVKKATITEVEKPEAETPPAGTDETPVDPEVAAAAAAYEPPDVAEGVTFEISLDDSYLMWIGYGGIMGSMEGGFSEFGGTIEVPGGNLENAVINVTVQMASVFSDAKALTKKLRGEEFFETEKYPEATFTSTSVKKEAEGYTVTGNLNLHGEEKSIAFPADITVKGDQLIAEAEFTFNRQAWGVDYDGTGDNFIKDDVLLKFEIVAEY